MNTNSPDPRRRSERVLVTPKEVNYWAIPSGIIITVLLWISTIIELSGQSLDTPPTTRAMLLVSGTVAASVICVLFVKGYFSLRALVHNQQVMCAETREIGALAQESARQQIALLEQAAAKLEFAKNTYWNGVADGAGQTSNLRDIRDRRN